MPRLNVCALVLTVLPPPILVHAGRDGVIGGASSGCSGNNLYITVPLSPPPTSSPRMVVAASALPSGAPLHLPLASSSSAGVRAAVRMRQARGQGRGQRQQRRRGDLVTNVSWVVRQDKEFLAKLLEPVATPLSRLRNRVSKALENFFWFRFLEEEGVAQWTPPSWPTPSYPGIVAASGPVLKGTACIPAASMLETLVASEAVSHTNSQGEPPSSWEKFRRPVGHEHYQ